MRKQEGLFRVSGHNEGLACPFKLILCAVGDCHQCQIYLDWQKLGEIIVICAWCSKVKDRKPNKFRRPVVSHGICPECVQKYFGIEAEEQHGANRRDGQPRRGSKKIAQQLGGEFNGSKGFHSN